MTTPDEDPTARLRKADPMNRRPPDDASSPTASRVFERSLARDVLESSPVTRDRRMRASRALPVLAVAAAIIAVVGLSLPRNTPGPVRATLGVEQAGATRSDRAELLWAARHQDAVADGASAAQEVGYQMFMDDLGAYPDDPTPAHVLTWLDQNCDLMGRASSEEEVPGLDCGLAAVPEILNEGPPRVAADVLRALATLEVGSPMHADRCSDWASVDPAWRAKVQEAESELIWVKRNGTRLSVSGYGRGEVGAFSASVVLADPAASVFVQCKPASELADHPELTVSGAMADYAEEHGGPGCSYGEDERKGLVPVDLAAACGGSSDPEASPAEGSDPYADAFSDAGTPGPEDDPNAATTTSIDEPGDVTTTSVGG